MTARVARAAQVALCAAASELSLINCKISMWRKEISCKENPPYQNSHKRVDCIGNCHSFTQFLSIYDADSLVLACFFAVIYKRFEFPWKLCPAGRKEPIW